jgi:hypothetical protein
MAFGLAFVVPSIYGQIFVAEAGSQRIGDYDATTGAVINASAISGVNWAPEIAVSGSNVFVVDQSSNTVGEYTTSGTALWSAGIANPIGIAVSGSNLFVVTSSSGGNGTVCEYTTSGTLLTASPISGTAVQL